MSIVIALALLLAFVRFYHPDDPTMEVRRHQHRPGH
jgi:hypothetical protein